MQWFSKSKRTLASKDVRVIISGRVALHVFVKKDDAEGADHYYLGRATALDAHETTMPDSAGAPLTVVTGGAARRATDGNRTLKSLVRSRSDHVDLGIDG